MSTSPVIVWLRQDLRVQDNPALWQAAQLKRSVVPVFIWAPEEEGLWPAGSASKWWLHQSLKSLQESFAKLETPLVLRQGNSQEVLIELVKETGASHLFWNRRYEPAAIERDRKIKAYFKKQGIEVQSFQASLLFEPWEVSTQTGKPYKVFTPFWKACLNLPKQRDPYPALKKVTPYSKKLNSLSLEEIHLEPEIDWAGGLRETWQPGEPGANKSLKRFFLETATDYLKERDYPDRIGTSRLSPYLHFGEISSFQIWQQVYEKIPPSNSEASKNALGYLREVGWREFAYHLLFHFPHTTEKPLRPEFENFPWEKNKTKAKNNLKAWQKGMTGFPLVDAGMRELWRTGWMHNRVRMIVASFLVKDLLIPWQKGAEWFWDTLVDADLANNTLGWQWTAGCGADAAPFFRIFNPTTQAQKFDPEGNYIRRWVPELKNLPTPIIFEPDRFTPEQLKKYGVELGKDYPYPLVDHAAARNRALEKFARIKS